MERVVVDRILALSKSLLEDGGKNEDFASVLAELGKLLSLSSQDSTFRADLAADTSVLDLIVDIITNSLLIDFHDIPDSLYVRLLRGILLLLRNLVTSTKSMIDIPLLLLNIQHFTSRVGQADPFFIKCLAAYIELLSNICVQQGSEFKCNLQLISDTFNPLLDIIVQNLSLEQPFLIFLNGCLMDDDNASLLLKNEANTQLLNYILKKGTSILNQDSLETVDDEILKIFEKIITNKSFKIWIESKHGDKEFNSILKVAQLVATLEREWDNVQCTLMMEWTFEYLQKWSQEAIDLLYNDSDESKLQDIHSKLVIVLDIISDLAKYHLAKQFLEHYNALECLIPLLRAAHENTEVLTLKFSQAQETSTKANKKKFPLVKSLIIEILAYILHSSFEAQEKTRQLHGLELLLSNCIIDDNNPYIKERSILCLRFAMEKNQKNQEFVAQLEAKQVVDDEALQEAGYEVEVENGKVKLKKK